MILLIYSGTVVFSTIMDTTDKVKKMRELASIGCKFNWKMIKRKSILKLIPIINIMDTLRNIYMRRKQVLQREAPYIIPLSSREKEIYKQNGSMWNLFRINYNSDINANMILIYTEKMEENIIYYTKIDGEYIIISSNGPVAHKPIRKQYEKLKEEIMEVENCIEHGSKVTKEVNNKALKIEPIFEEKRLFINNYLH